MLDQPALVVVAAAALAAAVVWGRSARRLQRAHTRISASTGAESEASLLARAAYLKDVHAAGLYLVVLVVAVIEAGWSLRWGRYVLFAAVVPAALSLRYGRALLRQARMAESRSQLEQRAEEVLEQEALAPRRWAARLAPEELAEIPGFEVGTLYRAGTGMMAGDFYDVFRTGRSRIAAVIGDVSGHGIEPSITAFQAKYLLRLFLRQFRDPGQALEELNGQVFSQHHGEEFISMAVVVFDTEAGTLRYASAGHPPAFLWHGGEVRGLEATGPLISLTSDGEYTSREVPLAAGDLVLLYTDGLAEARNGESLFGEDRIANHLRRDPGVDVDVLCKSLGEAAEDYASGPLNDDIAILAVRRTT
ncbi:MAG TPA: PP2C family protein-serine/threonine phosphatase [Acidimicrobiales bacterium]|nr:PP2C family protein-serine/threonine phosphatase [Acidimicrobiales bacterium]